MERALQESASERTGVETQLTQLAMKRASEWLRQMLGAAVATVVAIYATHGIMVKRLQQSEKSVEHLQPAEANPRQTAHTEQAKEPSQEDKTGHGLTSNDQWEHWEVIGEEIVPGKDSC
jgi:hypothetical protein